MMGFFRRIIHSRYGAFVGLGLLAVIALAFAAGDIKNLAAGSLGGGDAAAAKVGGETLTVSDLQSRVQRVYDTNRAQQPTLTLPQFFAMGGFKGVLSDLIDNLAISDFGRDNGMRIGKKLVDGEIASIPAFQDAAGKFSQATFNAILERQHIPEKLLRDDLAREILERQLVGAAGAGAQAPRDMVLPYASMLLEKRSGSVVIFPSEAFAPASKPDDATITRFFAANSARFALPEQRKIRYAVVDATRFAGKAQPSDAEIAQYYQGHAADYAATEKRVVRQLILPSEAAAKALAGKVGSASALDGAAKAQGLEAAKLAPLDRAAFAAQSSDAAAAAVFGGAKDAIVGPVRTGLGWALYGIEDVQGIATRPLAAVKSEIAAKLVDAKTKQALADLANKIDSQIGNGATFDEIVKANGLTSAETPLVDGQGRILSDPAAAAKAPDPALVLLAKAGFGMEQGDDPQIVPLGADQRVAIVAVGQIVPSGPPALASIRPLVERAYMITEGAKKARVAAEALRAKVAAGKPVAAAVAEVGVKLPPLQPIAAQRSQLGAQGAKVPEAMVALFSMKQGSARMLPVPDERGAIVVHLDQIMPGDAGRNAQVQTMTGKGLVGVLAAEYERQFVGAVRAVVTVTRNDAAIARIQADMLKGSAPQ